MNHKISTIVVIFGILIGIVIVTTGFEIGEGSICANGEFAITEGGFWECMDANFINESGTNATYGEMWNYSSINDTWTFTIDAAGIYNNMTGLVAGDLLGFNWSCQTEEEGGCHLTALQDGYYAIDLSMSFSSFANGGLYGVSIAENHNPETNRDCYSRQEAATDVGHISISCIIDLNVGDKLSVMVENENTDRDMLIHTVTLKASEITSLVDSTDTENHSVYMWVNGSRPMTGNLEIHDANINQTVREDKGLVNDFDHPDGRVGQNRYRENGTIRWVERISPFSTGGNYSFRRHNIFGTFIDTPFNIDWATGEVTFSNSIKTANNMTAELIELDDLWLIDPYSTTQLRIGTLTNKQILNLNSDLDVDIPNGDLDLKSNDITGVYNIEDIYGITFFDLNTYAINDFMGLTVLNMASRYLVASGGSATILDFATNGTANFKDNDIKTRGEYYQNGDQGWTGDFTNGDGDTVYVQGGIIVNVVAPP